MHSNPPGLREQRALVFERWLEVCFAGGGLWEGDVERVAMYQ